MLKNLTPHAINVYDSDGNRVSIPPSGIVARVTTIESDTDSRVVGVPVIRRSFGDVVNLPDDSTPCIVSALVLAAVPRRPNTYAPDTGPTAIRDDNGNILGVTRFVAA